MTKISRRDFTALAVAGVTGLLIPRGLRAAKPGVIIGVQSYSFRDRSLDEALTAMQEIGLKSCELWSGHLEPKGLSREELATWRTTKANSFCQEVKQKFAQSKIKIQAFNYSFREDFSDAEIEQGFKMAQALGTDTITCSSTVKVMPRVGKYANQYKIKVGMHNHDHTEDPNEFSTPESFEKGMEGSKSNYVQMNLDIGHFTAANFDAVEYIKQHHAKILCLHIKDRKRDHGANLPFGEGDTPIKAVLTLLRDNKWNIPANIEYEYKGADTVTEVKKCFDYCQKQLA
ncbi:sugar phosphate isomerase/epimerase [Adhaeribacter arboris]|uniref:Sugar phosphate isomerase/epimerase n=1 Tax=Adhaeribacter arboris TaxID=2072846 RepID=A0A2T2YIE2_9BACT|nr:sugar phosphate isomerase/epimerase [Adhaeribacter arboris]PSR55257.1 sugar phosphate isomerase/epimerase [Adhaeribacter arboris]